LYLTYKLRHGRDFSRELISARRVAEYVNQKPDYDKRELSRFGLKSGIAIATARKYKGCRKLGRVNIVVPGATVRVNRHRNFLRLGIAALRLSFDMKLPHYDRIAYVEVGMQYVYVTVEVSEPNERRIRGYIGVDLNTAGHVVVAANPATGKVWKFGRQVEYVHHKYNSLHAKLIRRNNRMGAKRVRRRMSHILLNIAHQISRKLVDIAVAEKAGLKFEHHIGIKGGLNKLSFEYVLESWFMAHLLNMVEYKAKLRGVPVAFVDPCYSSQTCSKCGSMGVRDGKSFKCEQCGSSESADVNAAFILAGRKPLCYSTADKPPKRLDIDRDVSKGSNGAPVGQRREGRRPQARTKNRRTP
jgi:putative transposase